MLRLHHNIFVLALLVTGALSASGEPKRNVDIYCELINTEIPDRVSYPESPAYNESITSYYSGQERDLRPGCIFHPQDTSEVSRFVKLVTKPAKDCTKPPNFAVRSGGHMIWPGSANINTGITIDMRAMNELTLSDDKSVATLGVGGVWSDIYPQLVPHNLTVMGGRVSGIGVGGLATGGTSNSSLFLHAPLTVTSRWFAFPCSAQWLGLRQHLSLRSRTRRWRNSRSNRVFSRRPLASSQGRFQQLRYRH